MKKYLLLVFFIPFTFLAQNFGEVQVDINSGNPAFPFPQFLAYEYDENGHRLENLAHQNPDGLVHAEMELRIREAWEILVNRFYYTGESHAGVQYIQSTEGCGYIDCSEGVGYGLIAAAYMGDKTIFDGIWFREHDLRLVTYPRYIDGVVPNPNYPFGKNAIKEPSGDSATDGDVDIALGLLMAWRQWGDDSGYTAFNGDIISYKQEALNVIRGLVERQNRDLGDCRSVSGVIGLDGYFKKGNTWGELTDWANENNLYENMCPEYLGPQELYVDYVAPSYFRSFMHFLEEQGDGDIEDEEWHIPQLQRAEASSDWLMGKLYDQAANTIPTAGSVIIDSTNEPIFANVKLGEDFRYGWRTILNHTWHGNPEYSWNPETHQVEDGGNSNNLDMANRFSTFINDPRIFGNGCVSVGGDIDLTFSGPSQLFADFNPNTSEPITTYIFNWMAAVASPSAVSSQDFDLMGKLYRNCAIEWDTEVEGDGNLTSVPKYFHGFFRLLGMLITTGNLQSPMNIEPEANVKIYSGVDKTFSFTNDEITYTFSYRNYGSVNAENVVISDIIPEGLEFVSATNGGVLNGSTLTWDIGTVSGFESGGLAATIGEVSATFRVLEEFSGRVCNPVTIETSSGEGWTSNDFPNVDTEVMQRNCVDIVEKALEIEKSVDYEEVNPGDVVTYTVDIANSSSGGYVNGGRSGVNFSYARDGDANGDTQGLKVRLFHSADEPYINYENYRVSIFLNDNSYKCIDGTEGCTNGWGLREVTYDGGDGDQVLVTQEDIVPGSDENGSWNQRVIVQFADQKCAPLTHILRYYGLDNRIHEGGSEPLRGIWDLYTSNYGAVDWSDDWSWDQDAVDADGGNFYPITNDWTDPDNPNIPVTVYHNEACELPTKTVNNILIEEWDGYTWRRIYGSGPVPGRDVENVVFRDVLPDGFEFVEFVGDAPLGIDPIVTEEDGRTVITWEAESLQISQNVQIVYKAIAGFSTGKTCETEDEVQSNLASVSANNEAPIEASADVVITCNPVILPPPPSSMVKEVSPISAEVGEQVEYTIAYKNEDGSPIEVPLMNASDWTAQTGSLMTVGGGTLMNTQNTSQISTYNYSHGTNGSLEVTIEFSNDSQFGFALRHTGGDIQNGLYLVFKPGSTTMQVALYNGTELLSSTESGTPGSTTDIKVLLNEGDLNVWLGDTTSPSPSWVASDLPIRAGYFGFINGTPTAQDTWGSHTVTRFYSAMDSAFNVQISDPIPDGLDFVSSDEGENFDRVITFPIVEGPMLAGSEVSYSWTAVIESCPSELQAIENLAYTNILGIPENTIAAQAILDCSGEDLCGEAPEVPTLVGDDTISICLNETAANLEDYVTADSDHELVWFDGPSRFDDEIDTPVIDTSEQSEITYYVAQKENDICGEGDIIGLTVIVGGSSVGLDLTTTIESGESVDFDIITEMGFISGNVEWVATENINVDGESLASVTQDTISDTLVNNTDSDQEVVYTIQEVTSEDCGKGIYTLTVAVLASECIIDVPVVTNTPSYCVGEQVTEVFENNYIRVEGTLIWYANNNPTSTAITTPNIDTSIAGNRTFYVSQIVDDCESERVEFVISVSEGTDEVIQHGDVVISNTALEFNIFEETGLLEGEFEWSATSNRVVNGETTTSSTDLIITDTLENPTNNEQEVVYTITPTDCNEAIHVLTVIVRSLPSVEISSQTVVEGEDVVVELEFSKPTISESEVLVSFTSADATEEDLSLDDEILTIPAGTTFFEFSRPTIDDNLSEPLESFLISISSVNPEYFTYEPVFEQVSILDNDGLPSIELGKFSIEEGETKEVNIRLSNPSSTDITIEVTLSFTDESTIGSDYQLLATGDQLTVSFLAGETEPSSVVSITAIDDSIPEGDQVLIVFVDDIENGILNDSSDIGEITILDDDLRPTIIIDTPETAIEGNSFDIPIYLNVPALAGGLEVEVIFNDIDTNGDFDATPQIVIFEEGSRIPSQPLIVDTIQDLEVENDENFEILVNNVTGFVNDLLTFDTAIATIKDNDEPIIPDCTTLISPLHEETDVFSHLESLEWEAVADASGYHLTIGTLPGGIDYADLTIEDGSYSYNLPTPLENDLTYYVNITPFNVNETAQDCMEFWFITEEESLPPDCSTLTLAAPLDQLANVAIDLDAIVWNPIEKATGYYITIGTTSGGNDIEDITVADSSYVLPVSLEAFTTYYVNIVPFNPIGEAEGCTEFSFITGEDLSSTINCTEIFEPENAEANVELTPYISWDSVDGADGYFLNVGTITGGVDVVDNLDVGDNTFYLIEDDLTENTTYYVTIYPYNVEGTNTSCGSQYFVTQLSDVAGTKYGLSPNGDGINDYWEIDKIDEFPDNEVLIYNRWGSLVYYTKNYDNNFNVFRGEANQKTNMGAGTLSTGTYFYEIRINGDHDLTNLKGFVVLKR